MPFDAKVINGLVGVVGRADAGYVLIAVKYFSISFCFYDSNCSSNYRFFLLKKEMNKLLLTVKIFLWDCPLVLMIGGRSWFLFAKGGLVLNLECLELFNKLILFIQVLDQ